MRKRNIEWMLMAACACVGTLLGTLYLPLPPNDFSKQSVQSLRIADRNGIVLREFLNDAEGRGEWKPLSSIAPVLRQATIAVEDRRFYSHPGVDPVAIARSLVENIRAMRFKSGGSTITQQVIRNVYHQPRTLLAKSVEMWEALRLERMFSKEEILEQYLNRAPYGNQLFGVASASNWYFGKPVSDLSLAEAAFIASLPNAPSALNPYKNPRATRARQLEVLRRMQDQRMITKDEYDRACEQPVAAIPPEAHFRAPHVASMVEPLGGAAEDGTLRTTIDYPLQEQIQWLIRGHLRKLAPKNVHNAAAIVIDNSTGEIRALVGSADFFDTLHQGEVNGATALRQPGSAIKPFMYGLALEHGFTPATLLADIPTAIPDHHGDYVPENYDKHFHGPVRLRTALACSYNVPAVRVLQSVGTAALLEKLRDAGCSDLDQDAEYYGFGLTLGNGEVTLLQLTTAYMAFANGGVWKPSTLLSAKLVPHSSRRVYDETSAYLITNILKDNVARRPAFGGNFHFPFECAVKTGTTKDYKDNWTIGYTTCYTVGIWVGNFNGETMRHVSGVSGAGPIFADVINLLHSAPFGRPPMNFVPPKDLVQRTVCARSGKIPTRFCAKTLSELFVEGSRPSDSCDVHREFMILDRDGVSHKRVYEVFPREYSQWAASQGLPTPPPGSRRISFSRPGERSVKHLVIVSPNSGDYFKVDPVLRPEYQRITIAGFIPPAVSRVTLRVNGGKEIPFDKDGVEWTLQKGVFRFQLQGYNKDEKTTSTPVVINVE